MSIAFFGNVASSPCDETLSTSTISASYNATTSSVSVSTTNTGTSYSYTFSWQQTGTSCTINTSTSSSTTFTGTAIGSTSVFCNITNPVTGVVYKTPQTCTITWTGSTPGPPIMGTPSKGNQTFTINWTAPVSDGGSAITGYYVQNSTDNGVNWSTAILVGVVLTYQWTGLTNGTSYIGRVAAVNAFGTGSYSANSSPPQTPATTSTAPTMGTPSSGDKSFTINWTAPGSTGGSAITGYYVQNSTDSGANWSTAVLLGVVLTYTWSGNAVIYNGSSYIGRVQAVNAIGNSPFSSNSTPAKVPTFAAPSCSVTGTAGYPSTSYPGVRPLAVTINPTACVNYSYTIIYVLSNPYESNGTTYQPYFQETYGGAGTLIYTTGTASTTRNIFSIQQDYFGSVAYYGCIPSNTYFVKVITYNNDSYGVESAVASYATSAYTYGPPYRTTAYSSVTGTFTVTGSTYVLTSGYAIPNTITQITSLIINAASNGTVTICTAGRNFTVYFSGNTTGTFSQSQNCNTAPFSTNSGTVVRSLGWNVTDTGYNCSGAGKIRVNGGGTITTWATNQRTNVTVSITGDSLLQY
jgi:hypothetical protein